MQDLTWVLPPSVEIATCQTASIVTINDTVRVKHWNNLEHKLVSELNSSGIITYQKVNDTLHHEG